MFSILLFYVDCSVLGMNVNVKATIPEKNFLTKILKVILEIFDLK